MLKGSHIIKKYAWLIIALFITFFTVFVKLPDLRSTASSQLYQIFCEPVFHFMRSSTDTVYAFYERFLRIEALQLENKRLKTELQASDAERIKLLTLEQEVARLRGILGLQPKLPFKLKIAEVVALDHSADRKALWVNAGTAHGVQNAVPVIDHKGIVGQVVAAGRHRSLVLALQDPLFRAHVVNLRTDERAVLTGESQGPLQLLRYVHRDSDVHIGDIYITSGLGKVFPHGIGVGKVTRIEPTRQKLEQAVWIMPFVDAQKAQEVFIILGQRGK